LESGWEGGGGGQGKKEWNGRADTCEKWRERTDQREKTEKKKGLSASEQISLLKTRRLVSQKKGVQRKKGALKLGKWWKKRGSPVISGDVSVYWVASRVGKNQSLNQRGQNLKEEPCPGG